MILGDIGLMARELYEEQAAAKEQARNQQAKKCQHRCECKHERVQFCAKCKVVHCLDCQMEWKEQPTWTYSYSHPTHPYQWINCQGKDFGNQGNTIPLTTGSVNYKGGLGAVTYTGLNNADNQYNPPNQPQCSHQGL
jgi:hypothetical protein